MTHYDITIGELTRSLPILQVKEGLKIAFFNILGDNEITEAAAKELAPRLPECDYFLTAESKGIPIASELARIYNMPKYFVLRKSVKPYMKDPVIDEVYSITTQTKQILCLERENAELISGMRIIIIDDVISTGDSLEAMERIVTKCGGIVTAKAAILAEGDAADRDDIIFLEKLPLFFE